MLLRLWCQRVYVVFTGRCANALATILLSFEISVNRNPPPNRDPLEQSERKWKSRVQFAPSGESRPGGRSYEVGSHQVQSNPRVVLFNLESIEFRVAELKSKANFLAPELT